MKNSYNQLNEKKISSIILRAIHIYFIFIIFPFDINFWIKIYNTSWFDLSLHDFISFVQYSPNLILSSYLHESEYFVYFNILFFALISLLISLFYKIEKTFSSNDYLIYWIKAALRYRVAVALISFGLIKLFPIQIPYPSLSALHTNYGDFLGWKIYFHTFGITPGYVSFLGGFEIACGVLLLFRKTATFGAGLTLGFIGNILAANYAYQIDHHYFAFILLISAFYLFSFDLNRLFNLLWFRHLAKSDKFSPVFDNKAIIFRRIMKGAYIFFIFVVFLLSLNESSSGSYLIPKGTIIPKSYGFYNVKHFILNNDTIPFSQTHRDRWQNVIFENWPTISIKTAKSINIDFTYGNEFCYLNEKRSYESAGIGGRRYYNYIVDTIKHSVKLINKNPNHSNERYELTYKYLDSNNLIIKGWDENKNLIEAHLERINKKYMLKEGRRKPVKL